MSLSLPFGSHAPHIAWTANFINGDAASSLARQPKCKANVRFQPAAPIASPAGSYPIVCSGAEARNYIIHYVPGTLTVTVERVAIDYVGTDYDRRGAMATLSSRLLAASGPVVGRKIAFTIGRGKGRPALSIRRDECARDWCVQDCRQATQRHGLDFICIQRRLKGAEARLPLCEKPHLNNRALELSGTGLPRRLRKRLSVPLISWESNVWVSGNFLTESVKDARPPIDLLGLGISARNRRYRGDSPGRRHCWQQSAASEKHSNVAAFLDSANSMLLAGPNLSETPGVLADAPCCRSLQHVQMVEHRPTS